jgi:hypothetical protein
MNFWKPDSVRPYFFSLAALRIYLAFHLTYQTTYLWAFRLTLFSPNGLYRSSLRVLPSADSDNHINWVLLVTLVLIVYEGLVLLMAAGIGRNWTIGGLFLITATIQKLNPLILNGGHNLLYFLLLFLSFTDSFQHFTLVRTKPPGSWRVFFSWVGLRCIQTQVCLVYVVSGIAKCHSEVWYHGTALYYVLQLERFNAGIFNRWIYGQPVIETLATYAVWLWEIYFPAFLLHRYAKVCSLAFGTFLHLGIALTMMLYDFASLFIAVYLVFLRRDEILWICDGLRTAWRRPKFFFALTRRRSSLPRYSKNSLNFGAACAPPT